MTRPSLLLLLFCSLSLAAPDKSGTVQTVPAHSKVSIQGDSYNSGVGTSYTVPLTASYNTPVSKETRKYSVSADDLERADLSVSSSLTAPKYSGAYQTPVSNYLSGASSDLGPQQAEDRDGAHHGHGHGHGHGHHGDHGAAASSPVVAPEATYDVSAPVSQGNLYYYYYPVQAEPLVDKSDDDELDPLVLVLLPITVIVGILAILSVFNISITNGRADGWFGGRSYSGTARENPLDGAFGSFEQLKVEVDKMLERYYHALESESCMDRVVCELGTKAKDLSMKEMLMTALDWIIPDHMANRIATFKSAVNEGYEVHQCKEQFYCDSEKLIQTSRK